MSGAIPLLPQYAFMAWSVKKHRDNLTFLLSVSLWIHLACPCEHSNVSSGSIKGAEILYHLSDCRLLKDDSATWN
jgi:hypothetical protein